MALKINKTFDIYGEKLEIELYAKIVSISGNKERLNIYVDHCRFDNNEIVIDSMDFSINPDLNSGNNFIRQGYLHLKTLGDYTGSIDC